MRRFRAKLAASPARFGGQLAPESLHCTHRALRAFLRWADLEGYAIDPRLLRLPAPRLPRKEATVFHATQVRALLSAAASPTEVLMLRILIGERVSLGVASHWPFDQWGRFLPEHTTTVSMLDRLLHHAVVVVTEGESYRMREARSRGGGLPKS